MGIKIGLIGSEGRMGKTIATLHPIIPVEKKTARTSIDCDVLIDFSSHLALLENLSAKKPIVIGTTGHPTLEVLEKAAEHLPIFYASNFSLGAAILNEMAKFVSKHFPADVDLIETHHAAKKDAPSGTALHLAKSLKDPTIHSIRSGTVIGEHTLIFNNAQERLTLSHQVHSREAFARGALAAAYFLVGKPAGLYSMDDLFG
jgi:4-hydroxy-tetrahydrodipicolinate reductase